MPAVVEVESPEIVARPRPHRQPAPPGEGGVRCPKCHWKPDDKDRWACSCGHVWNTFRTHGRCPGCGKQWTQTQCLNCGAWSPHEAWYVDETVSFPA